MFGRIIVLALTLAAGTTVMAEVFKWVDEDGKVHYSDKPSGSHDTQQLDIQSRPTDAARIAAQRAETYGLEKARGTRYDQEREGTKEDTQTQRDVRAERAQNCEIARDHNRIMQQSHRLYKPTEAGERKYLSDDETDAARAEAAQAVREWCG